MTEPIYLVVIGTSAGGMQALTQLLAQLPTSLPAAILVVQHLAPDAAAEDICSLLQQHTRLPCSVATNLAPIEAGRVYLAPPDRQLMVRDGYLLVVRGPHENSYRPAVDALFRSAAVDFNSRLLGIILTGLLHDGTAGLEFVKRCGGITMVQAPDDAAYPSMPESALRHVPIDYVVPLADMGALLQELLARPQPAPVYVPDDLRREADIAERVIGSTEAVQALGHQVPLSCPDCGGSLWQMDHGEVPRYRCHTGHTFTADWLLEATRLGVEETLWVALRMMEERKNLLTSLAQSQHESAWGRHQAERITEIKAHINRLREFLLNGSAHSNEIAESM